MKKALFILLITYVGISLHAQIVYPVTATSSLNNSGSVYLSDYTDNALNMLSVSLTFNDNNEPSWDVRLKMTIESSTVKIKSKASGTYTPITLYPGQAFQLSGSDLYEYFDYNNLESQGIAMSQLSQDGKLPEGTYSFCFEAVDFNSGKAISIPTCNITYVVLYDPPLVQTPYDETTIIPQNPQNIVFQWQDGTPPSYGSTLNTEYTLRLYEVTNNQVSPKAALANNQVIKIFTSTPQSGTMLVYDASLPDLDDNKRYVFTVQAEDINGRDVFKNDGISEPSWFSYGYSTGGNISLSTPQNNGAFTKNEQKLFEWNCPSNLASGQSYNYEYVITKINSGQTALQAIQSNTALHTETTTETSSQGSWSYLLQDELENSIYYAWQVKAFSSTTEIAASVVFKVKGPPLIEKFIAGGHEVIVRQAYNDDLNNFSGNGDVKFSSDGDIANIDFSGLKLVKSGERYVLEDGEIASKLTDMDIVLTADYSDNGDAIFKTDSLKLDKNRLAISGNVEWDFPLATKSSSQSTVLSDYTWFNYDKYYLNGGANVSTLHYELADPMGYTMVLNPESDFLISENKYLIRFKGNVLLPEDIKAYTKKKDLKIPFSEVNQLFYFTIENIEMTNQIQLVKNINIVASPTKVTFDFSDENSPGTLSADAQWKGLYINEFDLIYRQNLDSVQLKLKDNFFYTHSTDNDIEFWLESQGLHYEFEYDFPDANQLQFNTFGGICKKLKLSIDKNQVNASIFEGAIEILILSNSKLYDFEVPITEMGFQVGDFKSPIEGESFSINANNQARKVDVSIGRAVFTHHNHLDMTIDVDWLKQNISLSNIPNFCVWGNSNIGFKSPNSMMPLASQYTTDMEGDFEITLDSIGAGKIKSGYAFVFSSTIALGDDVSGKDGPPQLNLVANEQPQTRSKSIHTPGMGDDDLIDASDESEGGTNDMAGETSSISDMLKLAIGMGLTSNEEGVLAYPYIKINAVVAKFEGHLSIFHAHPDWGTGFHGYLYGKLLLPIAKEMSSHIIMGSYSGETYWFISFSTQIGERANQVGSKFLSKTPDGSGKTLKSKKLGKLTGANTLKVGIPMGPISMTGIEGRVYHNMSHTVVNTVLGKEGYSEFEYRPDVNTDFGFLVRASFIDTYTQGAVLMYTGALEATFGGGEGFRTAASEFYLGLGNLFLPGGLINASIFEGTGTGTIDFVNDNVYADVDVKGGLPQLCGQGTLDIELTDKKFDIELGNSNAPIYFVPGCIGFALEGWVDVSKKDVFFGAGIRAQMELNSPWIGIGDIASVKPYVGFVAAAGIHAKLSWNPKFEINDVGMWMHASAGVYCKYKWLGDEGEWTLGKVSLAGNFNLHIQPTPVVLSGTLKGSVEILSVDLDFEVDGSYEF